MSGLVLTRRKGQSVRIGEDIEVHVIRIGHGQVRIKVVAPRNLPIWRPDEKPNIDKSADVELESGLQPPNAGAKEL